MEYVIFFTMNPKMSFFFGGEGGVRVNEFSLQRIRI